MTTAKQILLDGLASLAPGRSIELDAEALGAGGALLTVNAGAPNVRVSNYADNAFTLENTGDKTIVALVIDVSTAMYPDVVFDDATGSGGDSISKTLEINDLVGASGAIAPAQYDEGHIPARGADGADPTIEALYADQYADNPTPLPQGHPGPAMGGNRAQLLLFSADEGGFEPGEKIGFSGDMDPNSIAGFQKATIGQDAFAGWDVGGVSGAEMIGATVTVFFNDGSQATAQLQSDGSQAGSAARLAEGVEWFSAPTAELKVNGAAAGELGAHAGAPYVALTNINDDDLTFRVVMSRGFNPVAAQTEIGGAAVADIVAARLAVQDFQANNAADFQIVDILVPAGQEIDLTSHFDLQAAPNGDEAFINPAQMDLAFSASAIDPQNEDAAIGPVSNPIYLSFDAAAQDGAPAENTPAEESEVAEENSNAAESGIAPQTAIEDQEFIFQLPQDAANGEVQAVAATVAADPGGVINAGAAEFSGEFKTWHKVTLDFTGPERVENSETFTDFRLDVTFTNQSTGEVLKVPGFFAADGDAGNSSATSGDVWRVNFTPPSQGDWTYEVSFRTGDNVAVSLDPVAGVSAGFMDGASGSFAVSQTDKTGDDLRAKGALQPTDSQYFTYAETDEVFIKSGVGSPENLLAFADFDNTPGHEDFVSYWPASHEYAGHVADWNEGDPTWGADEGKGLIGALNYLASKGVNSLYALTMNVAGDGRDVWPWAEDYFFDQKILPRHTANASGGVAEDMRVYDVSKLAQWDVVFEHAQELGIALHLLLQEQENDQLLNNGELGLERQLYIREMMARFGYHNGLIWNIGEENTQSTGQLKDMIGYMNAVDGHDRPIALHTFPGDKEEVYPELLAEGALDAVSLQSTNRNLRSDVELWLQEAEQSGKPVAAFWDEYANAKIGVPAEGDPDFEAIYLEVRATLWASLTSGASGTELYFGYESAGGTGGDLELEDFRTRDSAFEWSFAARGFFEQLPLAQMSESDALTSGTDGDDYVIANPGEIYAIYLPNGGGATLDLSGFEGEFEVDWYNPRTGGALEEGSVTSVSGGGAVSLGAPPSDASADWAVLVRKAGAYPFKPVLLPADRVDEEPASVLPDWLSFDPETRTFAGTPEDEHVGVTTVSVTVVDEQGQRSILSFDLTVENVNDVPTLMGQTSNQSVVQGEPVDFALPTDLFADDDLDSGDMLTLLVEGLPEGLSFDPQTGAFSGAPTEIGVFDVVVKAVDLAGEEAQTTFTFTVDAPPSEFPTVTAPLADQTAPEDAAFTITLPQDAFEDDGPLSYTATLADGSALPAWLSFDPATQTFFGTPSDADVGAASIMVVATDEDGQAVQSIFTLLVENTNDAPTLVALMPDQSVEAGQTAAFTLPEGMFADDDLDSGDALVITAKGLPEGVVFDPASGSFSGAPQVPGSYKVILTAKDAAGELVRTKFIFNVQEPPSTHSFSIEIAGSSSPDGPPVVDVLIGGEIVAADVEVTAGLFESPKQFITFEAAATATDDIEIFFKNDDGPRDVKVYAITVEGAEVDIAAGQVIRTNGDVYDAGALNKIYWSATLRAPLAGAIPEAASEPPSVAAGVDAMAAIEDAAFSQALPQDAFADDGALSFAATLADGALLPAWLSFDPATQTFFGTPSDADVGALQVRVTATDADGQSAAAVFELTVANVNDAPEGPDALEDRRGEAGTPISFTTPLESFTDVDADSGDALSYSIEGLPEGLSFDPTTGEVSGEAVETGEFTVTVTAQDIAGEIAEAAFVLTVVEALSAKPVAAEIAPQSAPEDALFNFELPQDAFEDDGPLSYTATLADGSPLPAWLSFDPGARAFSGAPSDADLGLLQVKVTATDADLQSAEAVFTLEVTNTNDAPTALAAAADQSGFIGEEASFTLPDGMFGDDDLDSGDALTLSAEGLPAGMSFDPASGAFSGASSVSGAFVVTVTATDLAGAAAQSSFTLTIADTPPPPSTHSFSIEIAGSSSPDGPPVVDVLIGGEIVAADVEVMAKLWDAEKQLITFEAAATTSDSLEVVFKNDDGPRDVKVYSITLDGTEVDIGAGHVIRTNGDSYDAGALKKIYWNATLRVPLGEDAVDPDAPQDIALQASLAPAAPADEDAPLFNDDGLL